MENLNWKKEIEEYRLNNELREDCTIMDCLVQDNKFYIKKLNEYESMIKDLKSAVKDLEIGIDCILKER